MTTVLFGWELALAIAFCETHNYIDHIDVTQTSSVVHCRDGYKKDIIWDGSAETIPKDVKKN